MWGMNPLAAVVYKSWHEQWRAHRERKAECWHSKPHRHINTAASFLLYTHRCVIMCVPCSRVQRCPKLWNWFFSSVRPRGNTRGCVKSFNLLLLLVDKHSTDSTMLIHMTSSIHCYWKLLAKHCSTKWICRLTELILVIKIQRFNGRHEDIRCVHVYKLIHQCLTMMADVIAKTVSHNDMSFQINKINVINLTKNTNINSAHYIHLNTVHNLCELLVLLLMWLLWLVPPVWWASGVLSWCDFPSFSCQFVFISCLCSSSVFLHVLLISSLVSWISLSLLDFPQPAPIHFVGCLFFVHYNQLHVTEVHLLFPPICKM